MSPKPRYIFDREELATSYIAKARLERSAGGQIPATAATIGPLISTVLSSWLRALGTIVQYVPCRAGVACHAFEDARVHVGGALRANHLNRISRPIDQPSNVDNAGGIECVLYPSIGNLSHCHRSIGVDGRPSAHLLIGKTDCCASLGWKRDGDQRGVHIHPRRPGAPDYQDEVRTVVIGKLARIGPSVANPDTAGRVLGVSTCGLEPKVFEFVGIGRCQLRARGCAAAGPGGTG